MYLFSPPTSYRSEKLANLSVIGKKMKKKSHHQQKFRHGSSKKRSVSGIKNKVSSLQFLWPLLTQEQATSPRDIIKYHFMMPFNPFRNLSWLTFSIAEMTKQIKSFSPIFQHFVRRHRGLHSHFVNILRSRLGENPERTVCTLRSTGRGEFRTKTSFNVKGKLEASEKSIVG